jgi:hypothetical protein
MKLTLEIDRQDPETHGSVIELFSLRQAAVTRRRVAALDITRRAEP